MDKTYIPNPIDTSDVTLSPELVKLANPKMVSVCKTACISVAALHWILYRE